MCQRDPYRSHNRVYLICNNVDGAIWYKYPFSSQSGWCTISENGSEREMCANLKGKTDRLDLLSILHGFYLGMPVLIASIPFLITDSILRMDHIISHVVYGYKTLYSVIVIAIWPEYEHTLTARFMGPSGADRTQVGPMLAPWTLLSGQPLERRATCNVR